MSPIAFMKTTLISIALVGLSACGKNADEAGTNSITTTTATQPADAVANQVRKAEKPEGNIIIASGKFVGKSKHITTGGVTIIRTKNVFKLVLADDFSLDGAPDPTIAFGNGKYLEKTNFSKLNKNSGQQEYIIPTDIDPNLYSQVYIWCKKFSVPLGVATLEIADLDEALDDTYGS